MSTLKQIAANRLNANQSTGPRTPAGKAVSSMNALKTGIHAQSHVIKGEDPESLIALTAEYYDFYHPTSPPQRALVDILISSEWLLRRFNRVEAEIWELRIAERSTRDYTDHNRPLAEAHPLCQESLTRLQRRIDSARRGIHSALQDLRRLQAEQPSPEPVPQPIELETTSPVIGFVPSPPPEAPVGQAPRTQNPHRSPQNGGAPLVDKLPEHNSVKIR